MPRPAPVVPRGVSKAREEARGGVRIAEGAGANASRRLGAGERERRRRAARGSDRHAGHARAARRVRRRYRTEAGVRGRAATTGCRLRFGSHRGRPRTARTRQRARLSDAAACHHDLSDRQGRRTCCLLEFCDWAPRLSPCRRSGEGARQPAGTDFRCGGTFSHRSECRIGIRHQILFYLNTLLPRDRVRAEPAFGRFSCAQSVPCVLLVTLFTAVGCQRSCRLCTAICPSGACGLRDGGGPGRASGDPKCKMRQFAYTACAAGYGRGSAEIIFENE